MLKSIFELTSSSSLTSTSTFADSTLTVVVAVTRGETLEMVRVRSARFEEGKVRGVQDASSL